MSLRDRLRHETAAAHARVDKLFGSFDFGTDEGYVGFLRAQATAWETLRPLLDPGSLARADALRDDLDRLGEMRPAPLGGERLPASLSAGHQYVLEGSRLGSITLLRELRSKAPAMERRASAYLIESGKIDGWKQLSTRLQIDCDGDDTSATSIDDALFVFGLFEKAGRATDSAFAKVS